MSLPYVQEPRTRAPGWFRLESTRWLAVGLPLTAASVAVFLALDSSLIQMIVGFLAFVGTVVVVISAVFEIRAHGRSVGSIVNLVIGIAANPVVALAVLVQAGILTFG